MELIRYHLPAVGSISARLHDESAHLFTFLHNADEIERLRTLDHLGAVRLAIEGAHHSRWEYTVTVLALIDRLATLPASGVKSEVRAGGVRLASSASELMSSWALLLAVGHVHWTFSSERVLLQELWRDRAARRRFLDVVDPTLKAWAVRVLRDGDYYTMYQTLVLPRLKSLGVGRSDEVVWTQMFREYVRPSSDQTRRSRMIFRRLRRIAYLGLDTQYAPGIVAVDLGRVLTDEDALSRQAASSSPPEDAELASLDQYMARHVYVGREVLVSMANRESGLRAAIRSSLSRDPILTVIEKLAAGSIQRSVTTESLLGSARLHVRVQPPFDFAIRSSPNPRILEEHVGTALRKKKARVWPMVWRIPAAPEWVLQLHSATGDRHAAGVAVGELLRRGVAIQDDLSRQFKFVSAVEAQRLFGGDNAESLILDALRIVFGTDLRWEWGSSRGPRAVMGTRFQCRGLTSLEIKLLGKDVDSRVRRSELEMLYTLLLGSPTQTAAAAIANLKAYRATVRTPVLELDSVVVTEGAGRMRLDIGEVKTGTAGPTAAIRQLRKVAKHINSAGISLVGPILIRRKLRKSQVAVASRGHLRIAV